jgi:hypothetical protein
MISAYKGDDKYRDEGMTRGIGVEGGREGDPVKGL